MEFHRFYFSLEPSRHVTNTTIAAPHVRFLGPHVAVASYIRLAQYIDDNAKPQTSRFEETRVWHHRDGQWRHVHFHRSANS
jgi:calcium/calmodulin-dependent protein kinase (CaM kinase) II